MADLQGRSSDAWWRTPTGMTSFVVAGATIIGAIITGVFGLVDNGPSGSPKPNDGTMPPVTSTTLMSTTSSLASSSVIRWQGGFRLNSLGKDLDLIPPKQNIGIDVDLEADPDAIYILSGVQASTWKKSTTPTLEECQNQVDTLAEDRERYEGPRTGFAFCMKTYAERYAFLKVAQKVSDGYLIDAIVWESPSP